MAPTSNKSAISRRELFSGALLRDLFTPVAATSMGVTTVTRFATALGTLFPEPVTATAHAASSIPVRCPW
jgi:hypothetical protein